MKVVFVTNGNLFHQSYLSSCLNRLPGIDYYCVESSPILESEQKARLSKQLYYDFKIIKAYENSASWQKARKLIATADLCIVGSENPEILKGIKRIYLRYAEHIFKTRHWVLNPKTYLRFPKMWHRFKTESTQSWMLCASSHTKFDFNFYGLYRNRCLKFGYFPKANVGLSLVNKRFPHSKADELRIIFVGRSVKWKHPEIAFYVLKKFLSKGVNCKLSFVSNPSKLRSKILKKYKGLVDAGLVTVIDELSPNDLMNLFRDSHLFIFPSDNGEGFGATLYEAMSSRMAVIANRLAGSTNILIGKSDRGFVYSSRKELDSIISIIANNLAIIDTISTNAKTFIEEKYNATIAAKNLVEFAKSGYTKEFPSDEPLSKL